MHRSDCGRTDPGTPPTASSLATIDGPGIPMRRWSAPVTITVAAVAALLLCLAIISGWAWLRFGSASLPPPTCEEIRCC